MLFSPPYGDSTIWELAHLSMREFSPPYGDGTNTPVTFFLVYEFSPPYGDGTTLYVLKEVQIMVFAPLRGWHNKYFV